MKHRTVVSVSVIVLGTYWFARFVESPIEEQLEKIYVLTPLFLCAFFGLDWYRSKDLEERIKKLETKLAELEASAVPQT